MDLLTLAFSYLNVINVITIVCDVNKYYSGFNKHTESICLYFNGWLTFSTYTKKKGATLSFLMRSAEYKAA